MNKLFTKIATAFVGIAMAVGVGVAVGNNTNFVKVNADTVNGSATVDGSTLKTNDVKWTASDTGTYASGGIKFNTNGAKIYKSDLFSGSVSSGMSAIAITGTYLGNSTSASGSSTFTIKPYISGTLSTTISATTSALTSTTKTTFNLELTNVANCTGLELSFSKGKYNIDFKGLTWTITYTSNTVNLIYDGNGAESGTAPASSTPTKNSTFNLATNSGNLAKFGYSFGGWNTKADGTGTNYEAGASYTIGTTDVTLYAKWNAKTLSSLRAATATPTKTSYDAGESFDPAGLVIYPTFSSESEIETNVADRLTWSPDPLTNGTTSVTGTYPGTNVKVTISGLTVTLGAKGTRYNPYSVSEAIAAAESGENGVYTKGIICQVDSYSSTYKSITYWISEDGTTDEMLEIYSGKNLNNTDFSAKSNLSTGQIVIVYGNLKVHNEQAEYDYNNYIVEFVEVVPTETWLGILSGKTDTFYNGSMSSNNTLSTKNLEVCTIDSEGYVADTYNSGIGYTLKVYKNNTLQETLDATSEYKTYSFSGKDATSASVVWTITATVEGMAESDPVTITVIQKAVDLSKCVWANGTPKTEYYAHEDTFSMDNYNGKLTIEFNDGSTTYSASNVKHDLYAFDENAENNKGEAASVPAHAVGGTINLSEETKYVLDSYHKDYLDAHIYTVITVKIPTLTITDNYTGKYYVGTSRDMDVTVTAHFGDETRVLEASEYVLNHSSVNPVDTTPININATWKIGDDNCVVSNNLTINPIVSSRTLSSLTILDQEFNAGENFVLGSEEIYLEGVEDEEDFGTYLDQGLVTFTDKNGDPLTADTRLLKSQAGTVTATYSEGSGEGKTVSTTFTLSVGNAVVAAYSEPTITGYVKVTSVNDIVEGDYLVYYGGNVCTWTDANNNFVTNVTPTNNTIAYTAAMAKNSVHISRELVNSVYKYTFKVSGTNDNNANKYIKFTSNSNSLAFDSTAANATQCNISVPSSSNFYNRPSGSFAIGDSSTVFAYNNTSNSLRFRFYKTSTTKDSTNGAKQYPVELYKLTSTAGQGDKVTYLKSLIDAYRLNNGTDALSICNATSGIYSYSDSGKTWATVKTLFNGLTDSERNNLNVQDYFGEVGKTYVDTYNMLIAKDPNAQQNSAFVLGMSSDSTNVSTFIAIIAVVSTLSVGGFFFIRKKKNVK